MIPWEDASCVALTFSQRPCSAISLWGSGFRPTIRCGHPALERPHFAAGQRGVGQATLGDGSGVGSALNEGEHAHPRRAISQRTRKLIERVFGWANSIARCTKLSCGDWRGWAGSTGWW